VVVQMALPAGRHHAHAEHFPIDCDMVSEDHCMLPEEEEVHVELESEGG